MHRTSRCWQLCPHLTHLFSPHTAHDRSIIFRFSGFSFPSSPLLKHQPWRPRTAATETIFYWFQSQPSATASSQHLLQQIQNEPITQECQWFAYRYTSRANVWFFGMSHSNQLRFRYSPTSVYCQHSRAPQHGRAYHWIDVWPILHQQEHLWCSTLNPNW